MVDKKKKNATNDSSKKIIAIIAAIIVIIILLFSLVSCNKKSTNKDTKERKVIEEKNKKKKDKDKKKKESEELTTVEETEESEIVCVRPRTRYVYNIDFTPAENESPIKQTTIKPTKYETVLLLVGDEEVNLEYTVDSYNERGALYYNKNNKGSSNGTIDNGTIYYDGQEVESIDNTQVGQYKVVYTYTNPDKVTLTKTRTVNVVDTVAPTATATGHVENGQYVVTISELSEALSDWDETNTKVFDTKQDTVTITDVNGNTNEVEVAYETDAPEITVNNSISGNQAIYTFDITDQSDLSEVRIGDTVLTSDNNYQYVISENGDYTITATDALENTKEQTFTVDGLVTQNEIDGALTAGDLSFGNPVGQSNEVTTSRNITMNNTENTVVKNVRYISSHSAKNVDVSTFKNPDGTFKTSAVLGTSERPITVPESNSFTITSVNPDNNNRYPYRYCYIYYEVENTTSGAVVENVKLVELPISE